MRLSHRFAHVLAALLLAAAAAAAFTVPFAGCSSSQSGLDLSRVKAEPTARFTLDTICLGATVRDTVTSLSFTIPERCYSWDDLLRLI